MQNSPIRLITILRGRGDDHVHVEIEVITVGTGDATGYAALSYVWGDTTKNLRPVLVNGSKVHLVTYNLWQALKHIRASYEDRVIWADAICINQSDSEEKSYQLQHMRWIYPQANTVVCWLGDDDGTIGEAFSELNLWADAYESNEQRSNCALQARAYLDRREANEMHPLGLLFSRPYFSRAWCLPEVCLLVCGLISNRLRDSFQIGDVWVERNRLGDEFLSKLALRLCKILGIVLIVALWEINVENQPGRTPGLWICNYMVSHFDTRRHSYRFVSVAAAL